MKAIARAHPFLIVGGFALALMIIGQFWQTPFDDDAEGFPRLFRSVWNIAFLPVQLLLGLLGPALEGGLGPIALVLALGGYFGAFIGLDYALTRIAAKQP